MAWATILAGAGLAGCNDNNDSDSASDTNAGSSTPPVPASQTLSFDSVARSRADKVVVPDGYSVDTLLAWGTPIVADAAAFDPTTNTAKDQAGQTGQTGQTGMHHDGMYLFQDEDTPDRGILVVNHENITRKNLLPNGRSVGDDGLPNDPEQIRREMAAHGISVVEIARDSDGRWAHQMSGFNRRITAMTDIRMSGPAAGSEYLVTPYSPDGTATRGTLNNCGRG